MKKRLTILFLCIVLIISYVNVGANNVFGNFQNGFDILINGEGTKYCSVICDDTHYVPLRIVFEKLGAEVFYRERDNKILALSRDGDLICHILGENTIIVNGEPKVFENSSFTEKSVTYIPCDMMSESLNVDGVFFDNQQLKIQKYLFTNEYHLIIADVLKVCRNSNFNPENFQKYVKYHAENPKMSIDDVIFRVNLGLDYSFYENINIIERPYELLVLVNKYNQLPAGFEQYNLVDMDKKYTSNDGKKYLLAGVAYENYKKMADDAKETGLSLRVVSAYRTEEYQRNLYNSKIRSSGKVYADNYSARAGHSEHQTGLAVDIGSTKGYFEYTSEFKWLQQHAHEYGFILRYPKGKEWITGYSYEPWHYRYVGTDAAKIIYEEGLTFEEYYAKYVCVNEFN